MADTTLKLNVEAGEGFFHLYDTTGAYVVVDNETGWGTPNTEIADVTAAVARVYLPNSDEYTEIDLYPSFPTVGVTGFEIIPEDLGLTEFPPGVYNIEYLTTLVGGSTLATNCYYFFYQPLACCIAKKKQLLPATDFSSEQAVAVLNFEALLNSAKNAACGGKKDCANEISDYLWTKCNCGC